MWCDLFVCETIKVRVTLIPKVTCFTLSLYLFVLTFDILSWRSWSWLQWGIVTTVDLLIEYSQIIVSFHFQLKRAIDRGFVRTSTIENAGPEKVHTLSQLLSTVNKWANWFWSIWSVWSEHITIYQSWSYLWISLYDWWWAWCWSAHLPICLLHQCLMFWCF